MNRRIGVLGGTFDPIHCGHLDLGEAAQRALQLTSVLVMPSSRPPHRTAPLASGFHRFAMAALAIAGRTGWQVSDDELTHDETSYTVTTLRRLHAEGYTSSELFFVIGADAFLEFRSWKDYPQILEAARFAVVSRPGLRASELPDRLGDLASRMTASFDSTNPAGPSIILIEAETADVSSTAIRQRCGEGRPLHGLVPASVEQHIEQHGLYRLPTQEQPEHRGMTNAAAGRLHGQS